MSLPLRGPWFHYRSREQFKVDSGAANKFTDASMIKRKTETVKKKPPHEQFKIIMEEGNCLSLLSTLLPTDRTLLHGLF